MDAEEFFSVFHNTALLSQRVTSNLPWYYADIVTDYNAALAFYAQGDFYNFGSKLGQTLVSAFGDHSTEIPVFEEPNLY